MCTGVGGPAGLALMGASGALLGGGISIGTQKALNGAVDWRQVGLDTAIGAISGMAGAGTSGWVLNRMLGRGASRIVAGATAGGVEGTVTGVIDYGMRPGPHTLGGYISAGASGAFTGVASGGIVASKPPWLNIEDMKCFKHWYYRGEYLSHPVELNRAGKYIDINSQAVTVEWSIISDHSF